MLSDAALLEIDRDELVDAARVYYDAELAERKLATPDDELVPAQIASPSQFGIEGGDLVMVASFPALDEANFARGLLQSAGIPCSFENERGTPWRGIGDLRLMAPAAAYDHACEILAYEISEEDLIAQAEAEAPVPADDSPDDEQS
jgi:hypothetical protein